MPVWFFVVLCVVVPAAWAIAMYQIVALVEKARARRKITEAKTKVPPIDYSI